MDFYHCILGSDCRIFDSPTCLGVINKESLSENAVSQLIVGTEQKMVYILMTELA